MRRAMELLEKRKQKEGLEMSKERDHTPVRNANPLNRNSSINGKDNTTSVTPVWKSAAPSLHSEADT